MRRILLLSLILVAFCEKLKPTRHVEVTADEEKIRDRVGYEAIAEIHREMDDDHSGSIDRKETSGFMKEDMQMRGSERIKREDRFHGSDEGVTVDEMWESWFESKERLWTTEMLVDWLTNSVNLPMYAEAVQKNKFDGKILPRIAAHNTSFLTNKLGIKVSVHRQKLRLSALDVVLFGYRDTNSKTKDVMLAFLFALFASVLILYVRQKQKAQKQVKDLSTRLTQLKTMETEFESIQKSLDTERSKRSTSDGSVNKIEMEKLRLQLDEATRRLEENSSCETPLILQPLLRKTCEAEMEMIEKQKQECIKEMKEAIELVDKLQKKQASVLSSLKLATGAASASDQVDSRIFALKNRMEKIHAQSQEIQERWMQIESLCGFSILYLGEALPYSVNHHYYGSSESSMSSSASAALTRRKVSATELKQSSLVSNGSGLSEDRPEEQNTEDAEKISSSTTTVVFTANPEIASDSISLASGNSTVIGKDPKKKKLAFTKLFKKAPSKNSLFSNGSR